MKPVPLILTIAFSALAAFIVGVMIIVGMYFSANNREVELRNGFNAQLKVNESSFDKSWKIIQQQAGVADHERDTFRQTYMEIMNSTKGVAGNGQLASFFTQAKVDVPSDLFKQLMSTIEAQRESFHADQKHLLRIKQEHDNVLSQMPSAFFVGGRSRLDAVIVTSSKTSEVFSSGQDNDVILFKDSK